MLTKDQVLDHYVNQNKSLSQMCIEFNITKKVFSNLCKKYQIHKSLELQKQASARSHTYKISDFIEKAKLIHNDKYDYSKSEYIKSNIPIKIICPIHGEFKQMPVTHLQGFGCQLCGGSKKLDIDDFIKRSSHVHNNKYDYSKSDYKSAKEKISIICPIHGEFKQRAIKHMLGNGCPRCSNRITTEDFIKKATKVHGDKYDYSKVDYKTSSHKITIICREHGEFLQNPASHLKGSGCSICANNYRLNTDEFIRRAINVHGNLYDYSRVNYKNAFSKVIIVCPEHGDFLQRPANHLGGDNCPKCTRNVLSNTNDFIGKAKLVHGDLYDYSKVNYKHAHDMVVIICEKHGEFQQSATTHLSGSGCPECAGHKLMDTKMFIKRAVEVHGDKYDYSKTVCNNSFDKVSIICPIHGEFEQSPDNHLYEKGCSKCAIEDSRLTQEEFITRAKEKHGSKFDYSKVNYVRSTDKVKIICPKHGEFEQIAWNHIGGNGCIKCKSLTTEEFIKRSIENHYFKYDYSKVNYTNCDAKVKIICSKHGEFEQTAWNHMIGQGCPRCNISKPQQEIADHVNIPGIIFNDRKLISPSEIDLLIEPMKLGIEHHGIFWHSYDYVESKDERHKHKVKQDRAEERGFRLLQIFEHEWMWKKDIVKSRINIILGRGDKVFARKCKVVELDNNSFNDFCEVNHLQGRLFSKVRYGLVHDGKLVMAVGFNGGPDFVCTRLCSALNLIVVGGVSKLFKRFVCDHNPKTVLSFADRRYSMGRIYEMLGFRRLYVTDPNYFYVKGLKVYSRMRFQKHKQRRVLELFDESASEAENMFMNGYRRLWDAGHIKYMWGKS